MQDIPYGYCHCGCGQKTNLARATIPRDGWVKGEPLRYVMNHHRRKPVDQEYKIEDHGYATPCWIWQGTKWDGYGRINREGQRFAHILYYVKAKGPIPEGMELDHLCHQNCAGGESCPHRACVNPDHLEAVLREINQQRGVKARGPKTHCKHGHEFTEENTIIGSDGARRCRECQKALMQRYYNYRLKPARKKT